MKKLILATVLGALSLSANCINMDTALVCEFDDKSVKTISKLPNVKYNKLYNTNEKITSIEVSLNNKEETLYLNLGNYKALNELKITKNSTSNAYIKLSNFVIKIQDNKVIKEVQDEKVTK